MKKSLIALIGLLSLTTMALVGPSIAAADGPPDGKGKPAWAGTPGGPNGTGGPNALHQGPKSNVRGYVTAETLGTGTPITGNVTVQPADGGAPVTFEVNASTACKAPGKGNAGKPSNAQCGMIEVGYYVVAHLGSPAIRVQIVPGRTFHCVGEVVGDPSGSTGSLTVACRTNGTTINRTFQVTADTKLRPQGMTFAELDDDDVVTVVGAHVYGLPIQAKAVVKHGDD